MAEYLRNLKQRDIAIAVIVLVALVAIAWWFLLYQPTREKIASTKDEIARLDLDIIKGRDARDALPELRAAVAELEAAKNEFLQELPRTNEVANLLNQLTDSARESNVIVQNLTRNQGNDVQIEDVRQLSFAVDTLGTYPSTLDFLRALEQLSNGRFTKIDRVDFSVGEVGEDTPAELGASIDSPPLSTNYNFSVFVYTGEDVVSGGN